MTNASPGLRSRAGVGAIVLCGGQSQRMGQSKAWLPFGHERLLQRVVRRLSSSAEPIVVVRAPGQTIPELPPGTLLVDDEIEHRGPLQGIAAGLGALRGMVDVAFVSSTDAPFVDPTLVAYLKACCTPAHDLIVPHAAGHHHPLAALYTLHVLEEIERMLAEDQRRLMALLDRVRTLVVPEEDLVQLDPHLRFLSNLNTPEDYRAALEQADDT